MTFGKQAQLSIRGAAMTIEPIMASAIFPLFAVLWLLICDRLGLVEDQPEGQ